LSARTLSQSKNDIKYLSTADFLKKIKLRRATASSSDSETGFSVFGVACCVEDGQRVFDAISTGWVWKCLLDLNYIPPAAHDQDWTFKKKKGFRFYWRPPRGVSALPAQIILIFWRKEFFCFLFLYFLSRTLF